jgi:hypothetical protein
MFCSRNQAPFALAIGAAISSSFPRNSLPRHTESIKHPWILACDMSPGLLGTVIATQLFQ